MKKPVALIIMDGFGHTTKKEGSAIDKANIPNIKRFIDEYPNTLINASGLDVGLPNGQMGNSEVGHTNIGAGRIVYQDLTRITKSIEDGDFFKNEVLCQAMENGKEKALHIMGLLSDGGVHSHIDHLKALLKMAKEQGVQKVYVHAFTDGRDTDPQSAIHYVREVEEYMEEIGCGEFATVNGRYYAMDRDKRWERVEKAYNAMTLGEGETASSASEAVENSYKAGNNDEFIMPTVITKDNAPVGKINDGDSVIFFNFRPDRAREITRAIVSDEFSGFEKSPIKCFFVCLTEYDVTIPNVHIAFGPASLANTLGEYLAKNNKTQLRAAETEKYAHVTFFFNGGRETPFDKEERILVPSPKVATYDLKPEMSAFEVKDKLVAAINENKYDFIVVNFANGDMVGHTGIYEAIEKAVVAVDACVKDVIEAAKAQDYEAIIIADHGNADHALNEDGTPNTAHSLNPVPCVYVTENKAAKVEDGRLADVAPTILKIMGLEVPAEMDGNVLIK